MSLSTLSQSFLAGISALLKKGISMLWFYVIDERIFLRWCIFVSTMQMQLVRSVVIAH